MVLVGFGRLGLMRRLLGLVRFGFLWLGFVGWIGYTPCPFFELVPKPCSTLWNRNQNHVAGSDLEPEPKRSEPSPTRLHS